jgi:chromosome partitioning protein
MYERKDGMNLVFVNGKGGTGKSTVCYLVGLALAQAGKGVCITDLDPQRSLKGWINQERDGFLTVPDHGYVEGCEIELIDTRPAIDDRAVTEAIESADVIVVPVSPSPADLGTARATVDVIREHKRDGAAAILVINRARTHTTFTDNARDVLSVLGLPIAATDIPERQCIQRAVMGGWSELDGDTRGRLLNLAIELMTL